MYSRTMITMAMSHLIKTHYFVLNIEVLGVLDFLSPSRADRYLADAFYLQ